jgi:hypothetical protein
MISEESWEITSKMMSFLHIIYLSMFFKKFINKEPKDGEMIIFNQ